MSRSSVRVLGFVTGLCCLLAGCGSPCHSGHYEVSYRGAYTSLESTQNGKTTVYYTQYHPERCDDSFICDWTCETLDQGKAEAHPKHKTLSLVQDQVDSRCNWKDTKASVK